MKQGSKANVQLMVWKAIILLIIAGFAFGGISVKREIEKRDQIIADLNWILDKRDEKALESLSSFIACGNGDGFVIKFTDNTWTEVKCSIVHEWVNGKYYTGDTYRTSPQRKQVAGRK